MQSTILATIAEYIAKADDGVALLVAFITTYAGSIITVISILVKIVSNFKKKDTVDSRTQKDIDTAIDIAYIAVKMQSADATTKKEFETKAEEKYSEHIKRHVLDKAGNTQFYNSVNTLSTEAATAQKERANSISTALNAAQNILGVNAENGAENDD